MLTSDQRIAPLLKWPGGKEAELEHIIPAAPTAFARYFEPFVGGGAVFLAVRDAPSFINDKSSDLIDFYRCVGREDASFFDALSRLVDAWRAIEVHLDAAADWAIDFYAQFRDERLGEAEMHAAVDRRIDQSTEFFLPLASQFSAEHADHFLWELRRNLKGKLPRMRKIEKERWELPEADILANFESAMKSAFYMQMRHLYNCWRGNGYPRGTKSAVFFFVREYAYASMFRFNRKGEFNVPYGGITYNRKNLERKVDRLHSAEVRCKFRAAVVECMDFLDFLELHPPEPDDFVFIDPPYDSDFKDYDQMSFGRRDQARLAAYLTQVCPAKFMAVMKHTDYVRSLYEKPRIAISAFDKKYMWTIKERNNRDAEHLLITNF